MIKTKRRTDGEHPFTHLKGVGRTEFNDGEVFGIQFQKCDVTALIRADNLGDQFAPILKSNDDFIGVSNDVVIGNDIAILRKNEA